MKTGGPSGGAAGFQHIGLTIYSVVANSAR